MHEINEYTTICQTNENGQRNIATVNIKLNNYNLVLGALRNNADNTNTHQAIELLEQMVDSWKDYSNENKAISSPSSAPFPNKQSFSYCIDTLGNLNDASLAMHEAERLIGL